MLQEQVEVEVVELVVEEVAVGIEGAEAVWLGELRTSWACFVHYWGPRVVLG